MIIKIFFYFFPKIKHKKHSACPRSILSYVSVVHEHAHVLGEWWIECFHLQLMNIMWATDGGRVNDTIMAPGTPVLCWRHLHCQDVSPSYIWTKPLSLPTTTEAGATHFNGKQTLFNGGTNFDTAAEALHMNIWRRFRNKSVTDCNRKISHIFRQTVLAGSENQVRASAASVTNDELIWI